MPRGSKKTAAAKVPVTLYWISTADHDEDWFIFAKSTRNSLRSVGNLICLGYYNKSAPYRCKTTLH
jgi:hypothetical protein